MLQLSADKSNDGSIASKKWDGVLQWLETAFKPYRPTERHLAFEHQIGDEDTPPECERFSSPTLWSRDTSVLEKKLNACQQWCLRRLLRISHLQRVTNTEVLRWTNQTQLSTVLCDRRLRLFRHVAKSDARMDHREHCAQLFQGYRSTKGVLLADPIQYNTIHG